MLCVAPNASAFEDIAARCSFGPNEALPDWAGRALRKACGVRGAAVSAPPYRPSGRWNMVAAPTIQLRASRSAPFNFPQGIVF